MNSKYLVRPNDFSIFELDNTNGCYRSWYRIPIKCSDGTIPIAEKHFTFENLTKNYGFLQLMKMNLKFTNKNNKIIINFYLGEQDRMAMAVAWVEHTKII